MPPTEPALARVGVYANAAAGRHRAGVLRDRVVRRLRANGHDVLLIEADSADEGRARTTEAVRTGRVDALAVIGGDGTAHLGANACAGTDVPLVLVPGGTGNDNARALGLPRNRPEDIVDLVTAGSVRRIDAGHAATEEGSRWWLGVLGGGFDTRVNDRGRTLTRLHGPLRYLVAVAVELRTFRGIPYTVQVDDERTDTTAMLVAVGNGSSFGGGMKVCPDASLSDGLLDVLILHRVGRGEFLRIFPKVFSGSHVHHPAVEIRRGRRVRLDAEGVRTTQADGEDFLPLPVELEVVPGALAVVAP